MPGIPVSHTQLNDQIGQIALRLKQAFDDAVNINNYLVATPDDDLLALGFTQDEINIIKSAYADLAFSKVNSFDSSNFVKKLYGLGI